MQALRAELVEQLHDRLRVGANAGGWAYNAGKGSRIEPTCWALLAVHGYGLRTPTSDTASTFRPHLNYLRSLQNGAGFLVETVPSLVNVTANAVALITLRTLGGRDFSDSADRLRSALVALKGVSLAEPDAKQDNTLQGWPWVRDTFSWVEPTAWALLALKLEGRALGSVVGGPRQDEAERLLLNRVCVGGGWNYGNASTLGQDLRAYVPTTAVALLALQNRRTLPAVQQSLSTLVEHQVAERGTMSLALVSLCLNLFGHSSQSADEALTESVERSQSTGNLLATAMALFALSFDRHRAEILRVP